MTHATSPEDAVSYPANHNSISQYEPGNSYGLHGWTHSFANIETNGTVRLKIVTKTAIKSLKTEPPGATLVSIHGNDAVIDIERNMNLHLDFDEQMRGEPWPLTSSQSYSWSGANSINSAYAYSNPSKHVLTIHTNPFMEEIIETHTKSIDENIPTLSSGDVLKFGPGIHLINETNSN